MIRVLAPGSVLMQSVQRELPSKVVYTGLNTLGKAGSVRERRPVTRRRSNSGNNGICRCQGRPWFTVLLVMLAAAIVCAPYFVLGPHMVLSVSLEKIKLDMALVAIRRSSCMYAHMT